MSTELLPAPAGTDRDPARTAVGADDRCRGPLCHLSWCPWPACGCLITEDSRCKRAATDTVNGKLLCSPHAAKATGL